MLNLLKVSPRRPSIYKTQPLEDKKNGMCLKIFTVSQCYSNLRGVSSETTIAAGPVKPSHLLTFNGLTS